MQYCQVIRKKISIRIKNVENPRGGGTVIHPDPDIDSPAVQQEIGSQSVPEPVSLAKLHDISLAAEEHQHDRMPTAVTIKEHIMVLNVNSNRKNVSHGFFAGVFGTLDRFGVVVDLISTSEVHVSMAIEDSLNKKHLDRLLLELKKSGSVSSSLVSCSAAH
jgi:aspartate kinase